MVCCSKALASAEDPNLLFNSLLLLSRFAEYDDAYASAIVDTQGHVHIIALLSHADATVAQQALDVFRNLARQRCLTRGTLNTQPLSQQTTFELLFRLYDTTNTTTARPDDLGSYEEQGSYKQTIIEAIALLCHGELLDGPVMQACCSFLLRVMRQSRGSHENVMVSAAAEADKNGQLSYAMWATSHFCSYSHERIQEALNSGLVLESLSQMFSLVPPYPEKGAVGREHDYIQESCVLPTEQLTSVFEFLDPMTINRAAFGCKDWFYDILCRDADLYACARSAINSDGVMVAVFRALESFVRGSPRQTEVVVAMGLLNIVELLGMTFCDAASRKELCCVLSWVVGSSRQSALEVLSRPAIVSFVLATLQLKGPADSDEDDEAAAAREAAYVVSKATGVGGNFRTLDAAIHCGWAAGLLVMMMMGGCYQLSTTGAPDSVVVIATKALVFETMIRIGRSAASVATRRASIEELLDKGIDIVLHILAREEGRRGSSSLVHDGGDLVSSVMLSFPEAFCDARSFFFMIVLPFCEAMEFLYYDYECLVEDDGVMAALGSVRLRRATDLTAARAGLMCCRRRRKRLRNE
ncbi:Hypothetical protein, putative [Bodo saltans]|uniref:Uncharacterized protein n=1 Tax=Bodo saltans TaxID=75058 RepID=A0A0S4JIU3_BODSA|nr:Hypothetical protein, putative [Bodo saltans]|eukprot:CUG90077.1 Hypothetical protein, putative [Bodo saltans]